MSLLSMQVVIDSQLFVWGVKKQATPGQEHLISKAERLVDYLLEEGFELVMPAPMLTELLSFLEPQERSMQLERLNEVFTIVPFDKAASEVCAGLIFQVLTEQDLVAYRKQHLVPKNKLKFDCMIVATAIVRGVKKIYTHDPDIKRFAQGKIEVEMFA